MFHKRPNNVKNKDIIAMHYFCIGGENGLIRSLQLRIQNCLFIAGIASRTKDNSQSYQ